MKRMTSLSTPQSTLLLALLCCLCLNRADATDSINVQQQSASAPPATSQFGSLVGNWKIRDFAPGADGSWNELPGADWNFYWILGGTAIQDDWISPGMDNPAPEAGRQFGTNIRIYNPKLERWEMAWASNTGAKVDTFLATHEDGALVMKGVYNGGETRITFHDITAAHFSWKMEQKNKETGQWAEIYRIEGDRVEERQ